MTKFIISKIKDILYPTKLLNPEQIENILEQTKREYYHKYFSQHFKVEDPEKETFDDSQIISIKKITTL